MITRRLTAASAAVALGVSAAIAAALPASAEDYYVSDSDLGVEDASSDRGYPDNTWFTGQSTTGTQTSTDEGMILTGRTMLLYGAAELPIDGDTFIELVQSAAVDADGTWSFQLPVYFDNDTPDFFTTFRPASNSTIPGDLDGLWVESTGEYFDGEAVTLAEVADLIDEAIDFGFNPALLAFGILVDTGWEDLTLRSISFAGDTAFFAPLAEDDDEDDDDGDDDDEAAPAVPVDGEATFTG